MQMLNELDREFFLSDQLAPCDSVTRLLYLGLLTMADENCLVQNRPLRLRGELLPYESCVDMGELITQLVNAGLLEEISHNDVNYLRVKPLRRMAILPIPAAIVQDVLPAVAFAPERAVELAVAAAVEPAVEPQTQTTPAETRQYRIEPAKSPADLKPTKRRDTAPPAVKPAKRNTKPQVGEWLTPEGKAQIRLWVAKGHSVYKISGLMGKANPTVYGWIKSCPEFAALFERTSGSPTNLVVEESQTEGPDLETKAPEAETKAAEVKTEEAKPLIIISLPATGGSAEKERKQPGYLLWLEEEKARLISGWVAQGLKTSQIAAKMGEPVNTVIQWKVMSTEFAALFHRPPLKNTLRQKLGE